MYAAKRTLKYGIARNFYSDNIIAYKDFRLIANVSVIKDTKTFSNLLLLVTKDFNSFLLPSLDIESFIPIFLRKQKIIVDSYAFYSFLFCNTCRGLGKSDWVTNVFKKAKGTSFVESVRLYKIDKKKLTKYYLPLDRTDLLTSEVINQTFYITTPLKNKVEELCSDCNGCGLSIIETGKFKNSKPIQFEEALNK